MSERVAVDANALMMPVEVGVRVFDELDRVCGDYDAVVPDVVRDELATLSDGAGEEATAASVGADLAARCDEQETDGQYADDALVALAESGAVDAVCTNDGPLRERVLAAGVPVIHLRGRNQLTRTQP
ncbi:twitching motility protein PilT [Halarchaeum sp. CBA1220]|uniref:PIN domain-containing protein n=1 Tax=Halarchaeum sp. CBA1220 TaxID=1853682 RepID=UPI000F3A95C2|nr:twitching motility protein PilT [Halarchaeum sp. CBA1220]QLC33162.1 twitching motility protein PilT [Halarchaeum sp. CBA1220]